jgi:signal transduction histidine kinase
MLERCVKEREQTRRVLRAANAGTWTWRPEKDEIEVSENFLGALVAPVAQTTMNFARWLEFLHPDDQPLARDKFRQARANGPGAPLFMEARMRPHSGDYRWFYVRADWYREMPDEPYELSGVNVDINELKITEAELRDALQKLRDADKRKDEFLAMLAHELRNPLAPIRAAAEVLKIGELDEAAMRETSEVIARQAEHMTSLVDDLLDVSRVTRGLVKLNRKALDVRDIVMDAVEQANPAIHARRHRLTLDLAPAPAHVMGDKKRLVQVMANLLHNAAKFTPVGGTIQLGSEVRDGQVLLCVVDNGIGIEPELAPRVFDLFAQAERAPDRASGGLGLGLALVKSLVELHGGSVACASEGVGKGSSFTVSLPMLAVDAGAGEGAKAGNTPRQSSRPLKVMVVDDNVDAAQMLALLVRASGHQVSVEYAPTPALKRSLVDRPDVCLLDIGLPEMDGNELARRLKAQPETAHAVLIAVTGYGQEHDRETSLRAGFMEHFVKPVDPSVLTGLLAQLGSEG